MNYYQIPQAVYGPCVPKETFGGRIGSYVSQGRRISAHSIQLQL